jgi:hypothetical protein
MSNNVKNKRFGKLEPKYSFILNKNDSLRLFKCPECKKKTHIKKFALVIHIDDFGIINLRKSCIFCSACEIIIVNKKDLESELTYNFKNSNPDIIGNDYFVIGTIPVDKWKAGESKLADMINYISDFKQHLDLKYIKGGWYKEIEG